MYINRVTWSENVDSFDEISEFANIAGPGVKLKLLHGLIGESFVLETTLAGELFAEVIDQRIDIFSALTQ